MGQTELTEDVEETDVNSLTSFIASLASSKEFDSEILACPKLVKARMFLTRTRVSTWRTPLSEEARVMGCEAGNARKEEGATALLLWWGMTSLGRILWS